MGSGGRGYDRRVGWFERGAAALRVALPHAPEGVYACPLCHHGYSREALDARTLTEEHVPPKHAGGKPLLLTCRECNSHAGSRLDSHAERADAVVAFASGLPGRRIRAAIRAEGVTQYVSADAADGAWRFLGVAKANAPDTADRVTEIGDRWAAGGEGSRTLELEILERFQSERVRLSWARAAYLAAFAHLGYAYAFAPALAPLIDQIRHPETISIRPPVVRGTHTGRALMAVTMPDDALGILVVFGERMVLLPYIGDDGFFERWSSPEAQDRLREGLTVNGRRYPWPVEPRYECEFGME